MNLLLFNTQPVCFNCFSSSTIILSFKINLCCGTYHSIVGNSKVLGKVWPGFKNKCDLDIYDLR